MIFRTIRTAARKDARLIVMDTVIPEGNEGYGAKWLDLLMLTLFAGRERDEEQWASCSKQRGSSLCGSKTD